MATRLIKILIWLAATSGGVAQAEAGVTLESFFVEPGIYGEKSSAHADLILSFIGSAAPQSDIFISVYNFQNQAVVSSLLRARARGVSVNVIIGQSGKAAYRNLKNGDDALAEEIDLKGLKGCDTFKDTNRCVWKGVGNGSLFNHNKFFLFSQLSDGSRDVIVQSTSNLDAETGNYQDAIIIRGDATLYRSFVRQWRSLVSKIDDEKYQFTEAVGDSGIKAYFFPQTKGDIYLDELRKVTCLPGSTIRLAHSSIRDKRKKVAQELMRLADEGCDVKVLGRIRHTTFWSSPGKDMAKILGDHLFLLPYINGGKDEEGNTRKRNSLHSKMMIIDAGFGPQKERKHLVYTGSHNLDGYSLRSHDEVMLRIENERIFADYTAFWQRMFTDYLTYAEQELSLDQEKEVRPL